MNQCKKRVLVVDDEPSITRLLKLNLEQTEEFEVMTENNPTQALRTAQSFGPDVILLDVLMPGMDGGELKGRFQASARFGKVPIIYLTAAATKAEVVSRGGVIGGERCLAKPVDIGEVVACLRESMGPPAGELDERGRSQANLRPG